MNKQEKTNKYTGAIAALFIITAMTWPPGTFQLGLGFGLPLISLANVLLLCFVGVGLFRGWRGFRLMSIAWLAIQLVTGIFAYYEYHVTGREFKLVSCFVSLLQVVSLLILLRRETRDGYGKQAAA